MSLPEISHRCRACGASVRASARFCPQCGEEMPKNEQHSGGPASSATGESGGATATERPSSAAGEAVPFWEVSTLRDGAAHMTKEQTGSEERAAEARTSESPTVSAESVSETAPDVSSTGRGDEQATVDARERSDDRIARPDGSQTSAGSRRTSASMPRPRRRTVAVVEDNLRPRVEKLRDASIVRLDEAAEDSGLSFVIIAIVMFLLFLLFLLMSKMLG